MDEVKPRDMDADQRHDEFTRTYGNDGDPAVTLVELVRAAGDFLTMIVRPEDAADGMHRIIGTMAGGGDDWREALADSESGAFSEWPFGSMLHNLSAYSRYGIDLGSEEEGDETEPEDRLREMVEAAERFLALCPLDAWLGKERTPDLENTISMARARWALDHDRPVEPEGLALLGGVSQGRMRNMVTGRDPEMHRENGLIPAHEALAWLEGRDNYFPSIWRTERPSLSREEPGHGDADMRFFFIPEARDGSVFHPELRRRNGFTIGLKGEEERLENFEDALERLQGMHVPSWRRPAPSGRGGWGIVQGVSWIRMSQQELGRRARSEKVKMHENVQEQADE